MTKGYGLFLQFVLTEQTWVLQDLLYDSNNTFTSIPQLLRMRAEFIVLQCYG